MTTFNANRMQRFSLQIGDREIYNDIRSQVDITEDTEVTGDGTPAEYSEIEVQPYLYRSVLVEAYGTFDVTFNVEEGHTSITWLKVTLRSTHRPNENGLSESQCTSEGGTAWYPPAGAQPSTCIFPVISGQVSISFLSRGKTSAIARITNPLSYEISTDPFAVYRYLAQEAIAGYTTIQTEMRTLMVRAVNEESIAKYGRRVMDLVWPLGRQKAVMQSMVDTYCARYSEPVCMALMTLEGITDENTSAILELRIDGKHQFIHPRLEMDEEFFVNNVYISYSREGRGILTGTFDLEQVRDMEKLTLFTLDVSELDGAHVLG